MIYPEVNLKIHNNMNTVNFGKKIPLTQCQIKDCKEDKYVPATFYELDCKDKEDILEVANLKGSWYFQNTIVRNMQVKHACQKISSRDTGSSFFILQKDNGPILGICQTKQSGNNLSVQFIESERAKTHKFVGQTMLASLGLKVIKENKNELKIDIPTTNAKPFYIDKCGFKECQNGSLKMSTKHLQRFIRKTQKRTKSPLLDIRG